jgi:DNA repair protein RadC
VGIPRLYVREVGGEFVRATGECVVSAARAHLNRRVRRGAALKNPQAVRDFLMIRLGALEREVFVVLLLDNRNRLIEYVELFQGTIDRSTVHPREVVKLALARNAASVIFAHPHPSGVAELSQADELITKRLQEALQLVEIRVCDHVLIAGGQAVSFAERGLL